MKPSPRTGRRRSHFGEVMEDDTHRATRDLHMPESMMKEEALRGSLPVPTSSGLRSGRPPDRSGHRSPRSSQSRTQ